MQQKEIFRHLENMITSPVSTSIVAYRTDLIDIHEHLDRYRWHDLDADPEDLPPENDPDDFFLVCISGIDDQGDRYDHFVTVTDYAEGEFVLDQMIDVHGWRRIEMMDGVPDED